MARGKWLTRRIAVVGGLAALLIAVPVAVMAQQFEDVGIESPYYNDVEALYAKGITTGCAPGLYCPKAYVTREQMAAFMNRLGALGPGKTPVVNADRLDGINSTQFVRSDQAQTYTCAGPNMVSRTLATSDSDSSGRWMVSAAGVISCDVHLPQGAVMTGLSAFVYDSVMGDAYCALEAGGKVMLGATQIAATPSSPTTMTFTIVSADPFMSSVDNTLWAYSLKCFLNVATSELRVGSVTLSYTGAP